MSNRSMPPIARSARRKGAQPGIKGNTALVITDEMRQQVRILAKAFPAHPQPWIAARLGIARSTLHKHFREELMLGRAELIAALGGQMIELALRGRDARGPDGRPIARGDINAMKFVLARLGGWSLHSGSAEE